MPTDPTQAAREMDQWLGEMIECIGRFPRELSADEMGALIHKALEIAEVETYATANSKFTFTLSGASREDLEVVRRHLTPRENEVVEFLLGS